MLLADGERALAGGDVGAARRIFERAASMRHAADSEMALVRTYMQGGDYRRALAFGAHTAGAHAEVAGASALYGWLLFLGGQRAAAQRLLAEAMARAPGDRAVRFVRAAVEADALPAAGLPLVPPVRLAPYEVSKPGVPPGARSLGSGTLVDGGRQVVVPDALLTRGTVVWIRNGLGESVRGRVERKLAGERAALVRLERPLPMPEGMSIAPRDPFPGSIAYVVEYAVDRDAAPGWPLLHPGFAGSPLPNAERRALGIALAPGPRGGPVFDASGRLAGVALPGRQGTDELLLPSGLRDLIAYGAPEQAPAIATQKMGVDEIYERSLLVSVQVLAVR